MQKSFDDIKAIADKVDFAHVESVQQAETHVSRDNFVLLEYAESPHYVTRVVIDQNSSWRVNQDEFAAKPLSPGVTTLMTDMYNDDNRDIRMKYHVYTLQPDQDLESFSLDNFVTVTFQSVLKLDSYHVHPTNNSANSYDKSHIAKNQDGDLMFLRVVAFKDSQDNITMTTFETPLQAYSKEDEARFVVFTSNVNYVSKDQAQ